MKTWPQGKPAVIIGDPASVFPQRLASFWRRQGLEVAIVTRRWQGPLQLEDGTKILQSVDSESPALHERLSALHEHWLRVERGVNAWERSRYRRAMGPPEHRDYHPSFANSLVEAVSIPPFVAQLDPAFIFGQEVFTYGLATALCTAGPKVLMPWGGDVFRFSETSSVAFTMVRRALHGVDLVVPGAVVGAQRVVDRFGVPAEKVYVNSWGIDRTLFRRASEEERRAFCIRHRIDPASLIILNIRRFKPRWGCDLVTEAFSRLALEDATLQFFALGGEGSESFVAEARKRILAKGLARRITILDGHIPDASVRQLVSVADIFTSLVRLNDMGSDSVKEGAAAGATPVVSDIASNREMERLGFRALFTEKLDASAVVAAVQRAIHDPALRAEVAAANQRYLEKYEDNDYNMLRLLDLIASCPVRTEESARAGISYTLAVIDEIIGGRKHLGLLSNLVRLRRGCSHPLNSARSAWRELRMFLHF